MSNRNLKQWNDKTWKKEQEATRNPTLPHEVAEAEEKDFAPGWGNMSSTDTGLDSVEVANS